MMNMVERVARILHDQEAEVTPWGNKLEWSDIPSWSRQKYTDRARAAIAAMMAPTEGMVDAADDREPDPYSDHTSAAVIANDYRAMIHAALEGE